MHAETGIVHQEVDRPRLVFEPRDDLRDIRPLRQIGGQHLHLPTHAAQFMRHLFEADPVARHEHDVVASRGQLTGEGGADARRPSRDESDTHVPYDTVQGNIEEQPGWGAPVPKDNTP